jgi:hypothetical protein
MVFHAVDLAVEAEQSCPGDGLQLTLRFSFQPRLTRGVGQTKSKLEK